MQGRTTPLFRACISPREPCRSLRIAPRRGPQVMGEREPILTNLAIEALHFSLLYYQESKVSSKDL